MTAITLSPGLEVLEMNSIDPTFYDKTHSGKVNVRKVDGQYFTMKLQWPKLKRSEFRSIWAFILGQRGRFNDFVVIPPQAATPDGVATGTPIISGAGQTGTSLTTSGWTASTTGIMKAGDLIVIAGDSKAYMLYTDADSDGSGDATLTLCSPLRASPADGAAITVSNIPLTVRLLNDTATYTQNGALYTLQIECEEAL